MTTIFIRTILIYLLLLIMMRILGKRQLGELEISELITTILLSEIASLPIVNSELPIMHAIIPLITIVGFEVVSSFIICMFPRAKNILSSPPSTLIHKGKINQKELIKNRISPEELISELRLKNITDPSFVEYAILEQNGLLSVIPKAGHQQPTMENLNLSYDDAGIVHIIISQGVWNEHNLKLLKLDRPLIEQKLKSKRISIKSVFLMTVDDSNEYNIILKERLFDL